MRTQNKVTFCCASFPNPDKALIHGVMQSQNRNQQFAKKKTKQYYWRWQLHCWLNLLKEKYIKIPTFFFFQPNNAPVQLKDVHFLALQFQIKTSFLGKFHFFYFPPLVSLFWDLLVII